MISQKDLSAHSVFISSRIRGKRDNVQSEHLGLSLATQVKGLHDALAVTRCPIIPGNRSCAFVFQRAILAELLLYVLEDGLPTAIFIAFQVVLNFWLVHFEDKPSILIKIHTSCNAGTVLTNKMTDGAAVPKADHSK